MSELQSLLAETRVSPEARKERVAIIGTGNYGISFGKRLLVFGYQVIYASRNPNKKYLNECFINLGIDEQYYEVTNIEDAWNRSDCIVILAVHGRDHIYHEIVCKIVESIKKQDGRVKSKVVIDISNRLENGQLGKFEISNAQKLDDLFASKLSEANVVNYKISVVKGFNLIDAQSLSSFVDNNKSNFYDKSDLVNNASLVVPLCGNDANSKALVMHFCTKLGIHSYDIGSLQQSALKLELSSRQVFSTWFSPSICSLLYFALNFIVMFFLLYLIPKKPFKSFQDYLEKLSLLAYVNKCLGYTCLQQLASVYLASVVASIYQLKNATKYKHFPPYLDYWLKTRKQFGLWAFMFASAHLICSLLITSPGYLKPWYRLEITNKLTNETQYGKLTLWGECNFITGILAYLVMLLVALTSINSIGNSLNWSEWRFVHTKLGLSCMALGALHSFVMYMRIYTEPDIELKSWIFKLTRPKLLAIVLPVVILILRFLFAYFRPISRRLRRIREGAV